MVSPELIRRYPFFGGLTESQLAGIAMIAEEVSFPKGAVIFEEGSPLPSCMYSSKAAWGWPTALAGKAVW